MKTILALMVLLSTALADPPATLDLTAVRARASEIYNENPISPQPSGSQESGEQPDAPEVSEPDYFNELQSINIRFEERVSSSAETSAEFYPTVILSATYCGPCKVLHREHASLFDSGQLVIFEVDVPTDLAAVKELGIIGPKNERWPDAVPTFYNFDPVKSEYVQVATGYVGGWSEAQLTNHVGSVGISIEGPPVLSQGLSEAFVDGESSLPAIATVLAAHIGRNQDELENSALTGNFYDMELDVPDSLPDILTLLTWKRSYTLNGVTVDWSGDRRLDINGGKVVFTPAPSVTLEKWLVRVKVELRSVNVSQDGRRIEMELIGVPDLVINFN